MATRIQLRGDTDANWTSADPVLAVREIGLVLDGSNVWTGEVYVGDGVTAISGLTKQDLTGGGTGGGAVDSVNGETGVVVLDADDIDDASTTNKFVTAAQITAITEAVQPGDNVSALLNDAGYITDYTVTEGDVTAHEGALTITESQISDLGAYLVSSDIATGTITPKTGDIDFGALGGGATFDGTEVSDVAAGSNVTFADDGDGTITINVSSGSATVGDGDYGDITVSGTGTVWTVDAVSEGVVTAHEGALSITESQISDLGDYQPRPPAGGAYYAPANSPNGWLELGTAAAEDVEFFLQPSGVATGTITPKTGDIDFNSLSPTLDLTSEPRTRVFGGSGADVSATGTFDLNVDDQGVVREIVLYPGESVLVGVVVTTADGGFAAQFTMGGVEQTPSSEPGYGLDFGTAGTYQVGVIKNEGVVSKAVKLVVTTGSGTVEFTTSLTPYGGTVREANRGKIAASSGAMAWAYDDVTAVSYEPLPTENGERYINIRLEVATALDTGTIELLADGSPITVLQNASSWKKGVVPDGSTVGVFWTVALESEGELLTLQTTGSPTTGAGTVEVVQDRGATVEVEPA